jgi:hypothetical protein
MTGRVMTAMETIRFRMRAKLVKALDTLASKMNRDRTDLLNEAVVRYLEQNIGLARKGLPVTKRRYLASETAKWFAAMDRIGREPLLKNGRKQPLPQRRKIFD